MYGLTLRERDVLKLLAQDYSDPQIAAALHIAESTVKNHVGRVLRKLGVRGRSGAAVYGVLYDKEIREQARETIPCKYKDEGEGEEQAW